MNNATIRNLAVVAATGLVASMANAQLTETQTVNFAMTDVGDIPTITFSKFDEMGGTRQLTGVTVNAVHNADLTYTIQNYGDALAFDEWLYEINMFMIYSSELPDFDEGEGEGEEEFPDDEPAEPLARVFPPSFTLDIIGAEIGGVDLPAGTGGGGGPFPIGDPSETLFPFPTLNLDITNVAVGNDINYFSGTGTMEGPLNTLSFDLVSAPFGSNLFGFPTFSTSGTLSMMYEYRDVTGMRESTFALPENVLDAFDLFTYLNEFEAGSPNTEYVEPSTLDQADFDAFIENYLPFEPTDPNSGGGPIGGGGGPGGGGGGPGGPGS